jgi:hypothetical protein
MQAIDMKQKYELWQQALSQLEVAVEQLDQAHATLKDCDLEDTVPARWQRMDNGHLRLHVQHPLNIEQLVNSAMGLLATLKEEELA